MNQNIIQIGSRQYINPEDVTQLRADINYTQIFFSDGKKVVVATTLKKIESHFQSFPKFFRINKSLIINLDSIRKIENERIILYDGKTVMPSRRRKKAFFELLKHS